MKYSLSIESLGRNGDGIGRLQDGSTVFVPLTAPGDVIDTDIEINSDGTQRGKMARLITPGEGRATPPCRHFGICGGCSLQHLKRDIYRSYKADAVLSVLSRSGVTVPAEVKTAFIQEGTRRRANFAARIVKGRAIIGFHERRSPAIRDTPDCLLITEPVRRVMNGLRPFLPAIAGEGQKMDVLVQCLEGRAEIALTGRMSSGWEAQAALGEAMSLLNLARISIRARDYEPYETVLDASPFLKTFGSLTVALAPGAFLQPSDEGEAALTAFVVENAAGARRCADLFCGHGTFTGHLIDRIDVFAADMAKDAIAALARSGAHAVQRDLFKSPLSAEELNGFDCVIVDPPRAGAKAQSDALAQSNVSKIIYISCSAQTFARDASVLMTGGYVPTKLGLVDQFIWSPHTELAAVFER